MHLCRRGFWTIPYRFYLHSYSSTTHTPSTASFLIEADTTGLLSSDSTFRDTTFLVVVTCTIAFSINSWNLDAFSGINKTRLLSPMQGAPLSKTKCWLTSHGSQASMAVLSARLITQLFNFLIVSRKTNVAVLKTQRRGTLSLPLSLVRLAFWVILICHHQMSATMRLSVQFKELSKLHGCAPRVFVKTGRQISFAHNETGIVLDPATRPGIVCSKLSTRSTGL